jgi:hypothetical protein
MNSFFTIIKSDYLQRTRTYTFLITLCVSLAVAYTFVPAPNATYSTIRIADYVGYYNSAWFGYVTAIMTSIFLSLIGVYLVNSGVKNDINSKVGQIIATTKTSNFVYLFSKVISNFLILLTIVFIVFLMSVMLFFLYNDDFSFELFQFIKPYVIITIPALFFIAVLAVIFEVLFRKYAVLQNIGLFFLFSTLLVFSPKNELGFSLDLFGSKIVMYQLEERVREITNTDKATNLNIGYAIGNISKTNKFEFIGVDFPASFLISRVLWMLLGIVLIAVISPFFHRFNIKEKAIRKNRKTIILKQTSSKEIEIFNLSEPQINFGILPIVKTEFLLLFRKGKKWLWLLNICGMVLLAIVPLKISHQMVLPILWFLQVHRLSDLTTKEAFNKVDNFVFTSFKPIRRIFLSQVITGFILLFVLSLPLLIRYTITINYSAVFIIVSGSLFVLFLSILLGIVSKGKKLFEVLFFMITYANINRIPFVDYFGGFNNSSLYLIKLSVIALGLGSLCFTIKKHQLKNL